MLTTPAATRPTPEAPPLSATFEPNRPVELCRAADLFRPARGKAITAAPARCEPPGVADPGAFFRATFNIPHGSRV